jgi:hypothetical protein
MKNFKALAVVLCICTVSFATDLFSGGSVPVINRVSGIGMVSLDMGQSHNNQVIAFFTIDNNTAGFVLTIEFENGGIFVNKQGGSYIRPFDLKITEANVGDLGEGITPLINHDLLPLIGECFTWESGKQTTATRNYGLNILASWNSDGALAGLYQETITTRIQAVF